MRGLVPRHKRIRYRGWDAYGRPIDRTVDGFHARVVQHECDHLDGVLYPQRIEDMRWFGFTEELLASGALPWSESRKNRARRRLQAARRGGLKDGLRPVVRRVPALP
jgi:hypothetical protein